MKGGEFLDLGSPLWLVLYQRTQVFFGPLDLVEVGFGVLEHSTAPQRQMWEYFTPASLANSTPLSPLRSNSSSKASRRCTDKRTRPVPSQANRFPSVFIKVIIPSALALMHAIHRSAWVDAYSYHAETSAYFCSSPGGSRSAMDSMNGMFSAQCSAARENGPLAFRFPPSARNTGCRVRIP